MSDIEKRLKQAREAKGLSIEEIEDILFIRSKYIIALEENNRGAFNSYAQRMGFLKTYADFLSVGEISILPQNEPVLEPDEILNSEEASPSIIIEDSPSKSKEIFEELGATLRERREILGLSLEEIEQHTHIPPHFAQMIEVGKFDDFPSPVQARGLLGNYSDFLEMNEDAVMLHYATGLQAKLNLPKPQTETTPEITKPRFSLPPLPGWIKSILSPDTLIFGGVGIAIIIGTIWGIGKVMSTSATIVPNPTAPPLSGILNPSPTNVPTATPTLEPSPIPDNFDPNVTAVVTVPIFSQVEIQVFVIVHQRTYLRVIVDGVTKFDGRTVPGANLPFTANSSIELLLANAAAIDVFFNEEEYSNFGLYGEVANVIFTRDGVITPTTQASPTLVPTELVTPTITPTDPFDLPLNENPLVP
jgi:cytoskeleton protein RodZ